MARSTREGDKRIFVVYRHNINKTLAVQGFADVFESVSGNAETVVETAEQKSNAFLSMSHHAKIMQGATTAEEAIEMAHKEKF